MAATKMAITVDFTKIELNPGVVVAELDLQHDSEHKQTKQDLC